MLTMSASGQIETEEGEFTIAHYTDYAEEAVVLYKGNIKRKRPVICRIHAKCLTSEVFFSSDCECSSQMRDSMRLIQQEGCGIIIYFPSGQGRGYQIAPYIATLNLKAQGLTQGEAFEQLGFSPPDKRTYNIAAKILFHLGIKSIRLLSDNQKKIDTLKSWGIQVKRLERPDCIIPIDRLKTYKDYFKTGQNLPLLSRNKNEKRLLIIADLCLDYKFFISENEDNMLDTPKPAVGGTAFNIALAFLNNFADCMPMGFQPVVFGKIGNDMEGRLICANLKKHGIVSFIETAREKSTSRCYLFYGKKTRIITKDDNIGTSSNDYDLKNLYLLKNLELINKNDVIFIAGHSLSRCGIGHSQKLMEIVCAMSGKIIFDIVPHNIYKKISLKDFNSVIKDHIYWLIGELNTFLGLMGKPQKNEPTNEDIDTITSCFKAQFIEIRFGKGNISQHILIDCRETNIKILEKGNTGWEKCPPDEKPGFGDKLTAKLCYKLLT